MMIKLINQRIKPDGNYPRVSKFFVGLHASFRYNMYIRYLMLAYFDMVFISGVILFDLDEDVLTFRSIIALFVLTLTFFLPWLVVFFLCIKFEKPKEERTSFSTVLLLVDRENRSRIFLPCYYFLRRLVSALLIVLGANQNMCPAYMQFIVLIVMSVILLFYMSYSEPYVTRLLNVYIVIMEFIYFMLAMAIFTFTDATGDIDWKLSAATACFALIIFFVFYNFMVAAYFCLKGRVALKANTLKVKEERKLSIERREQDVIARQEKRKRKEHRDWLKIENERKAKLIEKRDEMRRQGCSEEEINAKLPMEPVPKTGF